MKEWNAKLRKENYALDRQIRSIKREEDKIKKSMKEAAKKNDKQICTILAKEIIRSRKAINRIYASKAQLSSVQLQMSQQLGEINLDLENKFTLMTHLIVVVFFSYTQSVWISSKVNRSHAGNAKVGEITRNS